MQIHEQIYTSASELLSSTQSDLGVVAESAGFPSKIASQLMALTSYRILEGLPVDDPALHPSRIVAMPSNDGTSYSVSRVVYAGADHSGRTTPLAHHILIKLDDLKDAGLDLSEATGFLPRYFVDNWDQPPRRFDPPRTIDVTNLQTSIDSIGKADARRISSIIGWLARRFADGLENSTSVIFVLPIYQRDDALKLLGAIQQGIESTKQSSIIFQSHVGSSSDMIGNAHVVSTYPNSEYLREIQSRPEKRRPSIIDLSTPSQPLFNNVGFAKWYETKLSDSNCRQILQEGFLLQRSLSDIDESMFPDGFTNLWNFFDLYRKGLFIAQSDSIGSLTRTLTEISPMATQFVTKYTKKAIIEHFNTWKSKSDWESLLKIFMSDSWPEPTRMLCLDAIAKMPEISFPVALVNHEATRIPALVKKIDLTIQSIPNAWKAWLQGSPQLSKSSRRYLENRIASSQLSSKVSQQVIEMLITTGSAEQKKQSVINFLTSQIHAGPITTIQLNWLNSIEPDSGLLQQVLDFSDLPQKIATTVRAFLDPLPPIQHDTHTTANTFEERGMTPPHAHSIVAPTTSTRGEKNKTRRAQDPRKLIRIAGLFSGVVGIPYTIVIFLGNRLQIANLSTPASWFAVATVLISLIIGLVAHIWFSRNRILARQQQLTIFGYASVALMVVSSICVLALFFATFLRS